MKRFELQHDGSVIAQVEAAEVALLSTLARQTSEVISAGDLADPAVKRVLPDAYPDDAEASAEFRRFTQRDLAERKVANAARLLTTLDGNPSGELRLEPSDVLPWLRALTDIRLVLASRLGIEADGDENRDDIEPMARDVYDWLGFVQNSLIEAIDA